MIPLGVPRGEVRLIPYQPEWKQLFDEEKKQLLTIFQDVALDIDIQHIGSTSIPDLTAKPILDIALKVDTINLGDPILKPLMALGYREWTNRLGSKQRVYAKGTDENVTHHLHIIPAHHPEWDHKLFFRDYLRAHPESLTAYATLKKELSRTLTHNRVAYTQAKDQFIKQILSKAHYPDD